MPRPGAGLGFAVLACLGLASAVLAQAGGSLTNDDIVKMVQAKLSASVIVTTIESAESVKFDLSPAGLVALKSAGAEDRVIEAMQVRARARSEGETPGAVPREAPERSELLRNSKDPEFILRNFRTMLIDASRASFFGSDQIKAALRQNKDFDALKITIVDDQAVADVVLDVGYTFAWDFPFSLKHQNTSMVLASGKGTGPISGPAGATSVAKELVALLKSHRVVTPPSPPGARPVRKGGHHAACLARRCDTDSWPLDTPCCRPASKLTTLSPSRYEPA